MVHGVPVQLLPSWHPVVEEAIHNAVNVPYDTSEGAPMMRLISPTYLVASWRLPGAPTLRRGPSELPASRTQGFLTRRYLRNL